MQHVTEEVTPAILAREHLLQQLAITFQPLDR
jgi:hypothetical protein